MRGQNSNGVIRPLTPSSFLLSESKNCYALSAAQVKPEPRAPVPVLRPRAVRPRSVSRDRYHPSVSLGFPVPPKVTEPLLSAALQQLALEGAFAVTLGRIEQTQRTLSARRVAVIKGLKTLFHAVRNDGSIKPSATELANHKLLLEAFIAAKPFIPIEYSTMPRYTTLNDVLATKAILAAGALRVAPERRRDFQVFCEAWHAHFPRACIEKLRDLRALLNPVYLDIRTGDAEIDAQQFAISEKRMHSIMIARNMPRAIVFSDMLEQCNEILGAGMVPGAAADEASVQYFTIEQIPFKKARLETPEPTTDEDPAHDGHVPDEVEIDPEKPHFVFNAAPGNAHAEASLSADAAPEYDSAALEKLLDFQPAFTIGSMHIRRDQYPMFHAMCAKWHETDPRGCLEMLTALRHSPKSLVIDLHDGPGSTALSWQSPADYPHFVIRVGVHDSTVHLDGTLALTPLISQMHECEHVLHGAYAPHSYSRAQRTLLEHDLSVNSDLEEARLVLGYDTEFSAALGVIPRLYHQVESVQSIGITAPTNFQPGISLWHRETGRRECLAENHAVIGELDAGSGQNIRFKTTAGTYEFHPQVLQGLYFPTAEPPLMRYRLELRPSSDGFEAQLICRATTQIENRIAGNEHPIPSAEQAP